MTTTSPWIITTHAIIPEKPPGVRTSRRRTGGQTDGRKKRFPTDFNRVSNRLRFFDYRLRAVCVSGVEYRVNIIVRIVALRRRRVTIFVYTGTKNLYFFQSHALTTTRTTVAACRINHVSRSRMGFFFFFFNTQSSSWRWLGGAASTRRSNSDVISGPGKGTCTSRLFSGKNRVVHSCRLWKIEKRVCCCGVGT